MVDDEATEKMKRQARAAARASWPVTVTTLAQCDGARADDDGFVDATPGERLAMLTALSAQAWALSGKPMPDFTWPNAPLRIIRGGRIVD